MMVGQEIRFWGKEEIEWQDRAWRILGNEGQNETDVWSAAGLLVGVLRGVFMGRV